MPRVSARQCFDASILVIPLMLTMVMLASGENQKNGSLEFASNGLDETKEFDCSASAHPLSVGPTFDIAGSWELSFDFVAAKLEAGSHQLVIWGDGRGGQDPIFVRLEGSNIEAAISNTHRNTICGMKVPLDSAFEGKLTHISFRHLASTNTLELHINGDVHQKDATLVPSVDQPMPVFVGGANENSQRFTGIVRSVRLGNLASVAPANGLHERRKFNCSKMAYYRVISSAFDPAKNWDLTFDLTIPKFTPESQLLVCWGDDRPGMDTIFMRMEGPVLEGGVADCHDNKSTVVRQRLETSHGNRPVPVQFSYLADQRRLKLKVGKLVKTVPCEVIPWADRAMRVTIGGAGTTSQRFAGTLSSLRLGNVGDDESLESAARPLDEEFTPADLKVLAKLPPLNRAILEFALEHEGYLVDIGDCWNFANHAFNSAGAKRRGTSDWGDRVKIDKALPGDIFQSPTHVTIILQNHGAGRVTVLNANGPPNGKRVGRCDGQWSSDIEVFRPSK